MWIHELLLANINFKNDLKKVTDYFERGNKISHNFGSLWVLYIYIFVIYFLKFLMSSLFEGTQMKITCNGKNN